MAPPNEPPKQPPIPPPSLTPSASPSSSPSPSPSPPFSILDPSPKYHGTPPLFHTLALAATLLAPIGLLLPPRRLGLQTTILSAGAAYGASQLAHDYTGRSLYARLGGDARRRRLQADQARHEAAAAAAARAGEDGGGEGGRGEGRREGGWMEERVRREREVLAEGRGYWGLITDQIWEVWNGEWNGKKKAEEGEPRRQKDGSGGRSEKS